MAATIQIRVAASETSCLFLILKTAHTMSAGNRPPSQSMKRRGAERPLRFVAKDLVSSQNISWPAVRQFWDVHRYDADLLAVIAVLFHGTVSPLLHTHIHNSPKLVVAISQLSLSPLSFSFSTPTAGIAKKREKLPEQMAREMVDK